MATQLNGLSMAGDIRMPFEGEVYVRATVTTNEEQAIPAAWLDRYVTFQAQDADVWILFGADANVSAVIAQASTGSPPTMTVHDDSCALIPSGQERHFHIPRSGVTHFSHISKVTTGFLRMHVSTNV